MKYLVISLALSLASANAFAVSKQCEGATNDPATKGLKLTAQITPKSVQVADGDRDGNGKYPISKKAGTVAGEDGKTYLQYKVGGPEGCTYLLVDEDLLGADGEGWIKFRCRGEGFNDTKYFCKP